MKRLGLLIGLALASCDSGSAPPDAGRVAPKPERVRIQLNWVPEPEFGGIYAAEREGFFKAEGLDVELIPGSSGIAAPQLIASGKVEFGVVAGEQILTLRDQGGELVAIFASFQDDPMGIMVHAASPWKSIEELWTSDATVSCETNLAFIVMLNQKFGGKRLKFIANSEGVAQFTADPLLAKQCFVFAEPVNLELSGVATRVFPSSASGYNPYNVVIATSASYLREHPATAEKLARALAKGWASYVKAPGPTNERMAALNPSMSKDAMDVAARKVAPLVESADTKTLGLGAMTAERWTTLAAQLKMLGKIKEAPDASTVFRWKATTTIGEPAAPRN